MWVYVIISQVTERSGGWVLNKTILTKRVRIRTQTRRRILYEIEKSVLRYRIELCWQI